MSNAFLYYVFPLTLSTAFALAGFFVFRKFSRGARDSRGKKYGADAGCGGIFFMVVGGGLGLSILFTSPTPWQRQKLFDHIFRTPPEKFVRITIKPGHANIYRPLVKSTVTIDDPARLRQIADHLRNANEISPNHPRSIWNAEVEMVTSDGTFNFAVSSTENQGTLINVGSRSHGGGWNLGSFQVDGVKQIFEAAATESQMAD